jgi:hypothetical protein
MTSPSMLSRLQRAQWAVRASLALGVAASVAANTLHTQRNPISQPRIRNAARLRPVHRRAGRELDRRATGADGLRFGAAMRVAALVSAQPDIRTVDLASAVGISRRHTRRRRLRRAT